MSLDELRDASLAFAMILGSGMGIASGASAQTTYYVNGSCGNNAWTGTSSVCQAPDGPRATIQSGINAAIFGDTVIVADGIYTGFGNKNLGLGNGVALRSANGAANCIIDCENSGVGFAFPGGEGPETVVDGFTVRNGRSSAGGGFHCYYGSSPTITNCVITGNTDTGEGGGGIYCTVAAPTVTNCTIYGNTASAAGGGGIYCLFSNPTIINCTIVANTTTGSGGAIHANSTSAPTITNSVLWDNGAGQIYVDAGSTVAVSYSDVQGGWPGAGNMSSDPLLWNPGSGNLHLLPASPCIDAGSNTALPPGVLEDLDGRPRFVDDPNTANTGLGMPPVDLGAYEVQVTFDRIKDKRQLTTPPRPIKK